MFTWFKRRRPATPEPRWLVLYTGNRFILRRVETALSRLPDAS